MGYAGARKEELFNLIERKHMQCKFTWQQLQQQHVELKYTQKCLQK
jgi:hypothetical protein